MVRKLSDAKIIDKVQSIRVKNNRLWMDILRLAFEARPDEARKILQKIIRNDSKITMWMARLGDNE